MFRAFLVLCGQLVRSDDKKCVPVTTMWGFAGISESGQDLYQWGGFERRREEAQVSSVLATAGHRATGCPVLYANSVQCIDCAPAAGYGSPRPPCTAVARRSFGRFIAETLCLADSKHRPRAADGASRGSCVLECISPASSTSVSPLHDIIGICFPAKRKDCGLRLFALRALTAWTSEADSEVRQEVMGNRPDHSRDSFFPLILRLGSHWEPREKMRILRLE